MENENVLSCSVNIEWSNSQGIIQRKLAHKSAFLRLIRSDVREIFVEVTAGKSVPVKLQLKGISVHNKFMSEGKASIKFQEVHCIMFISNAPPSQLFTFLKTVFVKMTGEKSASNSNPSLRTQLLSNKPAKFEEISPVTLGEMEKAKAKISKGTDTTPSPLSRKRKLSPREGGKPLSSKRLYASSPTPNEPLDIEQKEVMEACLSGRNVFFTGSAGTGKSYLLKRIIGALPPDVTAATASTGVAACHIGGITLHQFAGIGTGEATLERSIELASRPGTYTIWRRCKHLIIDEISMVDGAYFEKIETIARKIRRNDQPFGGIQLILCGDFFQLPPVSKGKNPIKFCFETEAWSRCHLSSYELKKVHRQNDDEFIKILNCVRIGQIPEDMATKLAETSRQNIEKNGILATRLCSHTAEANTINESKLDALSGEKQVFTSEDSPPHLKKLLDQQTPIPHKLELKVGAQVMLLKNINIATGLVNGARGVVKSFEGDFPVVQFRNREYTAKPERWCIKTATGAMITRKQVPLKLAWAFSIHKSQGLTLDCVEMSLGKVFEAGQAYVALSRAQSLDTLRVLGFKASQAWANKKVLDFYRSLNLQMETMRLIPLGRKENKPTIKKTFKSNSKLMSKPLITIN
ncbi:ATP-dependent DNA helicase PIF1 [Tribolium madens]|uniref:ATP-dependent DNA helicase PIF1 n=1 Tax=Tribolium madens TaxID=41895 RepID=UPI001CF73032|nr:ATP-dependent DNA helicase PIF1 [Tribolium madens]